MHHSAIIGLFACMNVIAFEATSQVKPWLNGGLGDFRHSLIVVEAETTGFVHGENTSLGLKFWAFPDFCFTKLPSNGGKVADLFTFTMEPYFAAAPDTSGWQEFKLQDFRVTLRHPRAVSFENAIDIQTREAVIYVCCKSERLFRIARSHKDFAQEARRRGWTIRDSSYGFRIEGNGIVSGAYLEGRNWQAISADCEAEFRDEHNQMIMGDTLAFFAYVHAGSSPPLIVDQTLQVGGACYLPQRELLLILSSVKAE
jgi:hypothetical protein